MVHRIIRFGIIGSPSHSGQTEFIRPKINFRIKNWYDFSIILSKYLTKGKKKVSQNLNSLKFDNHVKLANFHIFFYVISVKFWSFLKSSNVIGSLRSHQILLYCCPINLFSAYDTSIMRIYACNVD